MNTETEPRVTVIHGNSLTELRSLPDSSVDSIVTDPPYELGFMGKQWDASGIAYNVTLWTECLRVLKPGGHLLAFGGTRTYHRMTCAIEDAGFEIRDSIHWIYGSGFPKSLDVSKAIDKLLGAERTKIRFSADEVRNPKSINSGIGVEGGDRPWIQKALEVGYHEKDSDEPASVEAQRWQGWGTALKPAHEPIVLARKPFTGTVANNVLEHGTGALNIDSCRIPGALEGDPNRFAKTDGGSFTSFIKPPIVRSEGRWPANVIHDGSNEVVEGFPHITDSDSASRFFAVAPYSDLDGNSFFYCPKPGKKERNAGLENLSKRDWKSQGFRDNESTHLSPRAGAGRTSANQNFHPTVKPIALMRYLIRLITPPGGTVLDPFAGSGTTLASALLEGQNSIGIELTADYLPIIHGRCAWAKEQRTTEQKSDQMTLDEGIHT